MKITVDKEGEATLLQLIDIVLKATGINNVKAIAQLLDIIKVEKEN